MGRVVVSFSDFVAAGSTPAIMVARSGDSGAVFSAGYIGRGASGAGSGASGAILPRPAAHASVIDVEWAVFGVPSAGCGMRGGTAPDSDWPADLSSYAGTCA